MIRKHRRQCQTLNKWKDIRYGQFVKNGRPASQRGRNNAWRAWIASSHSGYLVAFNHNTANDSQAAVAGSIEALAKT